MRLQRVWSQLRSVLCTFGVALILCQPASSPAATMHVILAGDTSDPNIGDSVQQDLNNITKLIETIANKTGMDYTGYSLDGDGLKSSSLNDAIRKLPVAADDLIFFYYSGHGGRYQATQSKWPLLNFQDQLVDFQQVLNALFAKRPRFLIALADCCNNYIDQKTLQPRQFKKSEPSAESYKKLFLYQQGYYIASGSIPGEPSIALRDGGMFTSNFLAKLNSELASPNPAWRSIQTTVLTASDGEQQHPQYDIKTAAAGSLPSGPQPTPAQPVAPVQTPILTQPPAPAPPPVLPQPAARTHSGRNLLRNGDFRQNTAAWNIRATNWLVKNFNGRLVLATNDNQHRVDEPSVYQEVDGLKKNRVYTFDAVICSPTLPRTILMVIWELGKKAPIRQTQQYELTEQCQLLSVSAQKQNNNTILRAEIYYDRGNPPEDIFISDAWLQ